MNKILKLTGICLAVGVVALLAALAWIWMELRASLPVLKGSRPLSGLAASVSVARDDGGVPTLEAANRLDATRAMGFLHAQDRFFQMDLARRAGAGELAELLGSPVLKTDRQLRLHCFRKRAQKTLSMLPAEQRDHLRAYSDGINAGLAALGAVPPEYKLLRCAPSPWLPEDSLLVGYSMFFDLQDSSGRDDLTADAMKQVLPAQALAFFKPAGTGWDSPIDGSISPEPPIPGPELISFTHLPKTARLEPDPLEAVFVGSNNWVVDGTRSCSGSALVADDMHLGHMVPNIWYRLRMQVPAAGPAGSTLDITGVTLPGVPLMIVGSNRHVAWAFTNSTLDTTDLVPLEVNPADPALYRTPDGWKRVESVEEVLRVRGGRDETLKVETTLWGPLLPVTAGSPRRAIAWVAHLPGSIDLKFMEMEKAETVEQSVALAPHCGIPAQNLVVGDRQGKIGWTLVGRLPDRFGLDGQFPESWAAGTKGWRGFLSAEKYPRMMNPASGRLWTANNRVSGDPAYLVLGAWGVDNGARARQIRDGLNHLTSASPADMLAIQLDDRAVFLARWQKLMLGIIGRPSLKGNRELEEMRRLVESWEGRASTTSCGYRFVRDFRENTIKHLTEPLLQRCRAYYPEFRFRGVQLEGPAWKLLTHKPPHLLNLRFQSYEALLESALLEALKNYQALKRPLAELTWGNRNLVAIRHPLSLGLSWLGWWLDMSSVELPGDSNMPRVHSPRAGASQRLAVSPGHEEEGYFHMPCGQSGHFLSPFYRAGHQAWVLGKPLPFLPGPARYRLTLNPEPIREGF